MRFSKPEMDTYSSALGFIGATAFALAQYHFIPERWGGMIAAVCAAGVGFFVQKPANKEPTTDQLEGKEVRDELRKGDANGSP